MNDNKTLEQLRAMVRNVGLPHVLAQVASVLDEEAATTTQVREELREQWRPWGVYCVVLSGQVKAAVAVLRETRVSQ